MAFGSGKFTYELAVGWGQLPTDWQWGWICAVACDSRDRVFVFHRQEHPLIVFDRDGNYLESWGEDVFTMQSAHGLYGDADDNLWTTEWLGHCVRKWSPQGELQMTLGTPGEPAANDGDPFNKPTDVAISSKGHLFVSDGYGNARVHKYTLDGELLKSWGTHGSGPGEFNLSHCVRVDRHDRVWICDRENRRIQIFTDEGAFIREWPGLGRPDTIYFDPNDDIVYLAELEQQLSIWTLDGQLITKWGGGRPSDRPGEFLQCPHGLWADSHGDLYVGEVQINGRLQKFVRT